MAQTPDELQLDGVDEAGLDPEDAFLEVGEDGFLVSEGRGWHLPADLDAWVMWIGIAVVAVAAFQTLTALAAGALDGWSTGNGNVPLPLPTGYYSLVLLGGILLLVIRRQADAAAGRARWVQAAACVAAGTGSCLFIAQLAGNIGVIVLPQQIAVPKAHEAFQPDGSLADAKQQASIEALGKTLASFLMQVKG